MFLIHGVKRFQSCADSPLRMWRQRAVRRAIFIAWSAPNSTLLHERRISLLEERNSLYLARSAINISLLRSGNRLAFSASNQNLQLLVKYFRDPSHVALGRAHIS